MPARLRFVRSHGPNTGALDLKLHPLVAGKPVATVRDWMAGLRRRVRRKPKIKVAVRQTPSGTVAVLAAVDAALSQFPPDEAAAYQLLDKAVSQKQDDWKLLATFGDFLCNAEDPQLRDTAKATVCFERSVALEPSQQPERYLYLAQCLVTGDGDGRASVAAYREGIKYCSVRCRIVYAQWVTRRLLVKSRAKLLWYVPY